MNIRNIIKKYLLSKNYVLLNYGFTKKRKEMELVRSLGDRLDLIANEGYQLHVLVRELCKKRSGNLVEVGVYTGGSAKLICEVKGDNMLYLFDTFEGLPEVSEFDKDKTKIGSTFSTGEYKADYEDVKNYLKDYKNIEITKGFFPDSGKNIIDKKFIFVHLDVDIYQSTLDSLKFFYDKMEDNGIFLIHDYSIADGVRKAVDEFFEDKPEVVIELAGTQALIIKQQEVKQMQPTPNGCTE